MELLLDLQARFVVTTEPTCILTSNVCAAYSMPALAPQRGNLYADRASNFFQRRTTA